MSTFYQRFGVFLLEKREPRLTPHQRVQCSRQISLTFHQEFPEVVLEKVDSVEKTGTHSVNNYPDSYTEEIDDQIREYHTTISTAAIEPVSLPKQYNDAVKDLYPYKEPEKPAKKERKRIPLKPTKISYK